MSTFFVIMTCISSRSNNGLRCNTDLRFHLVLYKYICHSVAVTNSYVIKSKIDGIPVHLSGVYSHDWMGR